MYVYVLEHNASTLELLRKNERMEKNRKSGQGLGEWRGKLLKPCVQSADNQNRNETQSALWEIWHDLLCSCSLLCLSSSLLWSLLACSSESRDIMILTPAFLVISVCLHDKDWLICDWYLGASWTELFHVDMDHISNALVSMGRTWSSVWDYW